MNCIEIAEANKDFNEESERPRSKIYDENIADHALSAFKFIKDTFIMKKKGINMKYKDLYDKYIRYCELNKINRPSEKGEFLSDIIKIGITYIPKSTKHQRFNWVEDTYDNLVSIFREKRFINEEDLGDVE